MSFTNDQDDVSMDFDEMTLSIPLEDADADAESSSTTLSEVSTMDDNVLLELESDIYDEMDDYVASNLLHYASPSFHTDLIDSVTETIYNAAVDSNICCETETNHQDIRDMVTTLARTAFHDAHLHVIRSYPPETDVADLPPQPWSAAELHDKIQRLKSLPQPTQRTPEWYEFRNNLLTASNLYKALGTQSQQNSLICEKCKPCIRIDAAGSSAPPPPPNVLSATHWGQKYESLSVMVYEAAFPGVQVDAEFGCIPHPDHSFIGASPDGIVYGGNRTGHMLEIKNTVSREIGHDPILSHWIQCQIQLETCDLEYCDYVQTNFAEISETEFYTSNSAAEEPTASPSKGVILHLISKKDGAGVYKYLYMPLNIVSTARSVRNWTHAQMDIYGGEFHLFETLYWKLNRFACVVIPRNRAWFQSVLPIFKQTWDTIEYERVHGYEHRFPKKREVSGGCGGTGGGGGTAGRSHTLLLNVIKLDV